MNIKYKDTKGIPLNESKNPISIPTTSVNRPPQK